MGDYIDNVLIRLKREYTKDELVTYLFRLKTELELELGIVRSERDEALHELAEVKKEMTNKVKSMLGPRSHYKKMKAEILALTEANRKLETENARLFEKVVQATPPQRLNDLESVGKNP